MARRVKWNLRAFEEIRRLPSVETQLRKHAVEIADACGDGFVVATGDGRTRSRAAVIAASPQARRQNRKNNTILRAAASRRITLPGPRG